MPFKVLDFQSNQKVCHRNSATIKSAIVINNKTIVHKFIDTYSTSDITVVSIDCKNRELLLISAYRSPAEDMSTKLTQIQSAIDGLNAKFYIICIDSNAHSKAWNDNNDDKDGEEVHDFAAHNNLIIMNTVCESGPTYESKNGQMSAIDLTLVSFDLINSVHNWEVLDCESVSDHKYISFSISESRDLIKYKSTIKYKTNVDSWSPFCNNFKPKVQKLQNLISSAITSVDLDICVNTITTDITQTCDKTFRRINLNMVRKAGHKWWTPELTQQKQTVNSMRRRYQRCREVHRRATLRGHFIEYLELYKENIISTKTQSWNAFVADNSRENPWGLASKIARNKITKEVITELEGPDGSVITDSQQISDHLLTTLFPTDDQLPDLPVHKEVRQRLQSLSDDNNFLYPDDIPFTVQEVSDVIAQQNPKKSPGVDGHTADIIQAVHSIDNRFFTSLFNKCLTLGYFPKQWRESVVKIIPKADKNSYRDPNAYRPISLLPVLAKVLEKLLINRIVDYLRKRRLVSIRQYGFTPQVSTETALHSLKNFIKSVYTRKGIGLVISLDISGAFNTLFWPKVLTQLKLKKCPQNLYKVCESYFSDRKANLWYLNRRTSRVLTIGCPQGSASGPWFFNIAVDDIFELTEPEVQINCFADDTLLMIYAEDISTLQTIANRKLQQIHEWGVANKLVFNPTKTFAMLCTNRLNVPDPTITFNGTPIAMSPHIKYLGLIIDRKLNFNEHCKQLKAKALKLTNSVIRFARNKYGLDSRALNLIIRGAILPVISYGSSVFWEALDRENFTKPLAQLQRQLGLRLIKGYKTLSFDGVNVMANLMPIRLYLRGRAVEYFVKNNIENQLTDHYFDGSDIEMSLIMRQIDVRQLPHRGKRSPITVVEMPSNDNAIVMSIVKTVSAVGAAIGVQYGDTVRAIKKFRNRSYCSHFQTELWLINQAFVYLVDKFPNVTTILVNSRSVLQVLQDYNSKNTFVVNIQKSYRDVRETGRQLDIRLRQHSDSESYRLMKREATSAAGSHNSYALDLIPINYVKSHIRNANLEEWDTLWQQSVNGRHIHEFIPSVANRQGLRHLELDFYVTQAITGHGGTNAYLKKFGIKDSDQCLNCREVDDMKHRLFECVNFEDEREDLKTNIVANGHQWPPRVDQLLLKQNFIYFKIYCKYLFNN